ncbi:MAG TPA: single-stranded DNA-binding protein [Acidimicrobiia bacterium]|nr:single-stranded DNA-binding protein [Acidimicrobiia bacterium]
MNDARLIYSIPEAAALLGISRSQAYSYARTGELRTVRFGGHIGVPRNALGEMLDKNDGDALPTDVGGRPINKVTVSGRLTRDAEMRTTRSGLSLCIARLAVQKRAGNEGAFFIDVVAYGDRAGRLAELRKGQPVKVAGRLDHREWTTGDGTARQTHQIIARTVDRLDQSWDPVA